MASFPALACSRSPAPTPGTITDPRKVGRSGTGGNPYTLAHSNYQRYRPDYPLSAVRSLLQHTWHAVNPGSRPSTLDPLASPLRVLEAGAGTGKFTRCLLAAASLPLVLEASEPAPAMREQFKAALPHVPLTAASAENLSAHYPARAYDLLVYAQCWHWVRPAEACAEAERLLGKNGRIAIVYNQLDVTYPWVKRLTRVGRTGDVQFAHKPPHVSPGFTPPRLSLHHWGLTTTPEQIIELVKTRSAYLRATEEGREHLLSGVRGFLYDEMLFAPQRALTLPYQTQVWVSEPRRGKRNFYKN